MANKRLAIVGAGASGTLLIAHLVQNRNENYHIYLIDRSGVFGPGLAYDLTEPCFLLNVRAAKMGAFAERQDDFYIWIQEHQNLWRDLHPDLRIVEYGPDDFVPRMVYGAYLRWVLSQAVQLAKNNGHVIEKVHDTVLEVSPAENKLDMRCKHKTFLQMDGVVFAMGNSFARSLGILEAGTIFSSPYDNLFLKSNFEKFSDVVVAGTSLSMVDCLQILKEKKFQGKVSAVSRHGLLPLPHPLQVQTIPPIFQARDHLSVSSIVRKVRNFMNEKNWADGIDSLRSQTNLVWRQCSEREQKILYRIFPWWSIARHRIPDVIERYLQSLRHEKRLKIYKGGIQSINSSGSKVNVTLKNGNVLEGDCLVNCTGFSYAGDSVQKICPKIPLQFHWSGCLKPVAGREFLLSESHAVYAMGPLLQGWNFESTAVHEIRQQAKDILMEIVK